MPGGVNPALQHAHRPPLLAYKHQHRSRIGIAARQHYRHPAGVIYPAQQRADDEVGWYPGGAHTRYPGSEASDMRERMNVPVPRATSSPLSSSNRASAISMRR